MAKTVGMRLRSLHSDDKQLLHALNQYSGYLISRGYDEKSIKYYLSSMANRDRITVLNGQYKKSANMSVPLVTDLHPAITCISSILSDTIKAATKSDPLMNILLPKKSLFVSFRKLPNLKNILCISDQNKQTSSSLVIPKGYIDTGCKCQVCAASMFGQFATPSSLPG